MLTPALKSEIQRTLSAASNVLPGYRPRCGQCEMIAHIARTMSDADKDTPPVIAFEAPTGTGKTLGYLAPLIPIAA